MIGRRELIALLGGAMAAAPLTGRAQQKALPVVAILDPGIPNHFDEFREGMQRLGYVEGQNISYLYRSAAGRPEGLPKLAAEIVQLTPHVIATASPAAVRAAKEATSTIPTVFVLADAISAGAVSNLARPGGNLTGISFLNTELSSKRLQILIEAFPASRPIAILWDANTPKRWAEATEQAGHALGVELKIIEVAKPAEPEPAFQAANAAHAQAVVVLASAFFDARKADLANLAAKYRLPTMYEHDDFVRAGGLISYGPSIPDVFRRIATHVDRILKGAKAGDLPVEQPTKFGLAVNLKAAKALGLTIPPAILARADEVIE